MRGVHHRGSLSSVSSGLVKWAAAGLLWIAASPSPAAAERWAVIRTASAPGAGLPAKPSAVLEQAARTAERTLAERHEVVGRSHVDAKIEERGAYRAPPLEPGELEHLRESTQRTLEDVAFGRYPAALARGEQLLEELSGRLARLRHHPAARVDVENACLYLVRAELRSAAPRARARARRCLQLAPGLDPDPLLHPPRVIEVVERERDALDRDPDALGELRVTRPEGPALVGVHLQGRLVLISNEPELRLRVLRGPTELQLSSPEGSMLARRVVVGSEGASLAFDPIEDRAFASGFPLDALPGTELSEVARWLGARHLLRISARADELHLERLDAAAEGLSVLASRSVPTTDQAGLDRAVRELAESTR